ncbi:MAG: hypothetical protein LBK95_04180 [Bifidobacteriaceae bacterium]|nr:hypothetical protein [Bifidobacteriaceae bacterium]
MASKHLTRRAALTAAVVAVAALVAPGLAACDQPKAAAVVGDVIITQDQMSSVTADFDFVYTLQQGSPPQDPSVAFQLAILDKVAAEVLEAHGDQALIDSVSYYTTEDVEANAQYLTEAGAADEATVARFKEITLESWDVLYGTRFQAMGAAIDAGTIALEDYVDAINAVKVNPRFGEFAVDENGSPTFQAVSYPWLISRADLAAEDAASEVVPESGQ